MISTRLFKGFQSAGLTQMLSASQSALFQQPARCFAKKKKSSDGEHSDTEHAAAAQKQ